MITSEQFADAVGRKKIAKRFGVGQTAVSNAVVRQKFPSAWYVARLDLAQEAGIECPPELFGQRGLCPTQHVDSDAESQGCSV